VEELERWRVGGLELGCDLVLLMGIRFVGYWFGVQFPEYV